MLIFSHASLLLDSTIELIVEALTKTSESFKWKKRDDLKMMHKVPPLSYYSLVDFKNREEALEAMERYEKSPTASKGTKMMVVQSGPGGGKSRFLEVLCDSLESILGDTELCKILQNYHIPLAISFNYLYVKFEDNFEFEVSVRMLFS